jgi:hypothetical protein
MESAEKASKILDKLFSLAIEKIETIIDEELQESHESISKLLDSSFPSILRKLGYSSSHCILKSTQIQSGGIFDNK